MLNFFDAISDQAAPTVSGASLTLHSVTDCFLNGVVDGVVEDSGLHGGTAQHRHRNGEKTS